MPEMTKALGHLKTARPALPKADTREKKHTVALIPGDSIGEEIAEAIIKIVGATGVSLGWDRCVSGQRALARYGTPLPESAIESILKHKVALKGRLSTPIGAGPRPLMAGVSSDEIGPSGARTPTCESPNVWLRKRLNLFASVRPAKNLPGLKSRYEGIDLVVVRENTEDIYAGIEHEVVPGVVESLKVVTEVASARIARFAFEYAVRNGRKSVACVHKANIMKMSDGLFLECARKAAGEYPGIAYRELIADNCIMQLVLNPCQFDVLVMGNMLGDIISDLCAGLAGGLGAVPGINIGEEVIVFEAIHGNAPHLEGKDLANPLPLLIPAVEMLRHLGEHEAADRIMTGVGRVLSAGKVLTPDLGGTSHTSEMTQAIIDHMAN